MQNTNKNKTNRQGGTQTSMGLTEYKQYDNYNAKLPL